ncbi:hypothetical protein [Rhodococcus sp. NCIMB 12038]|uniref:hypothetical protein n=1 Tax=Rhodococcus sp. NCIMB 12038 TaxID=933800 RepID=UPI000B3D03F6|nr:hypothetical protein [Rhodococcus sp. NCIMB 12038]OUS97400.1 hypothetical protein CA951_03400 [Rhodococcus sp. NCIMB 12038]
MTTETTNTTVGPKNPAYILAYNVLLSGVVGQVEGLHTKAIEVATEQEFCVGCNGDWPCETRRVLMEFRGEVADLQRRGVLT